MNKYTINLLNYFYLFTVAFIVLLPLLWAISTSLMLPIDSFTLPPKWIPTDFVWENYYRTLFGYYLDKAGLGTFGDSVNVPFIHMLFNSFFVSLSITFGQIFICSFSGYAFARFKFPFKNILFWLVMASLMIPIQVVIIPLYVLISKLGLHDTLIGLIIPAIPSAFGAFLMRQYYLKIPSEFEEAAVIDGASQWQVFWKVYFPLGTPGMVVLGILCFNAHWNEFLRPLIFLNTEEKWTIPVGLVALKGEFATGSISLILAGIVLSLIPAIIIYIFGQKYIVEGILTGSIKG